MFISDTSAYIAYTTLKRGGRETKCRCARGGEAYYGGATRGKPRHHRIQTLLGTPLYPVFSARHPLPTWGRRSFHPDTESRTSRHRRPRQRDGT